MSDDQVTLTHPDIPNSRFTCPGRQAALWEDSGWRRVTASDDEAQLSEPPAKPAPASRKTGISAPVPTSNTTED